MECKLKSHYCNWLRDLTGRIPNVNTINKAIKDGLIDYKDGYVLMTEKTKSFRVKPQSMNKKQFVLMPNGLEYRNDALITCYGTNKMREDARWGNNHTNSICAEIY